MILALQNDMGIAPGEASLILMPFSGAVVVGSLASRLPALTGSSVRPMTIGLTGIGLGGLLLAVAPQQVVPMVAGLLGVSALPHSGTATGCLVVAAVGLLSAVMVGRLARTRRAQ